MAVLPSFPKARPLAPDWSPNATLPAGSRCLSLTVNIETDPSARLATSASVPSGDRRTVVAPAPACSTWVTCGGVVVRSSTETVSSHAMPSGTAGSALVAAVRIAQLESAAIQTAKGGPTTEPGTSMVPTMRGGFWPTSIRSTVSGRIGSAATWAALSSSTVWLSFIERMMSAAPAGLAQIKVAAKAEAVSVARLGMGGPPGAWLVQPVAAP